MQAIPPPQIRWYSPLLELVLPAQCNLCNNMIYMGYPLCKACLSTFYSLSPACPTCGSPEGLPATICTKCIESPPPFRSSRSAYWYEGGVKESISALKYRQAANLGYFLGRAMAHRLAGHLKVLNCTHVVAVPTTRARQRKRGYNQAELLSKQVAALLGLETLRALDRHESQSQVGQNRAQRSDSAQTSYFLTARSAQLEGQRVLLIDDVTTTGATARACCQLLQQCEPKSLDVITVAYTPSGQVKA